MKTTTRLASNFQDIAKIAAVVIVLLAVQAANAQLDSTFGTGGVTVTNVAGNDQAIESFLLPDGKILVLDGSTASSTSNTAYYLIRYNANGTLDAAYGNNGIVALSFPTVPTAVLTKAARQSDGKIILTGGYNNDSLVIRINENGSLDTSFAGSGITRPNFNPNAADKIDGLVLQPDGKIIISSYFNLFGYYLYFVRYLPDGSLDSTFGNGGIINHIINNAPSSVIVENIFLQSSGKILVKGGDVLRFNADGSADSSFIQPTNISQLGKMLVQPDNKFIATTNLYKDETLLRRNEDIRIRRYNENGSVDTSFGINGITDVDITNLLDDQAVALAIQPDNQILVGAVTNVQRNRSRIRDYQFALARLSPSGAVNGKFILANSFPGFNGSVKILPDGKVLTVYGTYDSAFSRDLLLTRSVGVPLQTYHFQGVPFDFVNFDGIADPSVYRPNSSQWYFYPDAGNGYTFGTTSDILVPSDYLGDFTTEMAVFRPSNATWYIAKNFLYAAQQFIAVQFGQTGDVPVPADYDGDGKSDIAVFRPSSGVWYIRNSRDDSVTVYQFGQNGDKPVAGDYDGDGKADVAVFRPSNGTWYVQKSSGGYTGFAFGLSDDVPVQEDYDGDGKIDIAVFRPSSGAWYLIKSSNGSFTGVSWGFSTDTLVPADYDGDLKTDIAVFRPSDGRWYVLRSSDGAMRIYLWGAGTDAPLPKK